MNHNIPVVILCGGLGTRLREETEFKPKPMVEIGGKTRETHKRTGVPMSLPRHDIFIRIDSRKLFSGAPDSDKTFASFAPSRFNLYISCFTLFDVRCPMYPCNGPDVRLFHFLPLTNYDPEY